MGYIDNKSHEKFTNEKIILKKRKKIFLEDTRYYVEDIRKSIVNQFGFDRVYKQGLNIKTPLNLNLQNIATQALRKGLTIYDKRKGWRGSLANKKISQNCRAIFLSPLFYVKKSKSFLGLHKFNYLTYPPIRFVRRDRPYLFPQPQKSIYQIALF